MSLSDKIIKIDDYFLKENVCLKVEDVREAVNELKKGIITCVNIKERLAFIDSVFGEKLC